MKKTIALNINLSKIDRSKIVEGKKGKYIDLILKYNSDKDQYEQNGFIAHSTTKEEREQGVHGEIVGNAKELWSEDGVDGYPKSSQQRNPTSEPANVDEEPLPF
jgi:hypothetical protein